MCDKKKCTQNQKILIATYIFCDIWVNLLSLNSKTLTEALFHFAPAMLFHFAQSILGHVIFGQFPENVPNVLILLFILNGGVYTFFDWS